MLCAANFCRIPGSPIQGKDLFTNVGSSQVYYAEGLGKIVKNVVSIT